MKAWQALRYGNPREALKLNDIPYPQARPGELLIRVEAAALNPIDYKQLRGDLKRFEPLRFPCTMGFDLAGKVEGIGKGVEGFLLGDRVYARADRHTLGAFGEYCTQPASYVALMPKNISYQEAASFPLVALTTIQGLMDRAKAKAGQTILIHAGAGGLGSFAIQFCKALGLQVHATCSSRNRDKVLAHGADKVIAYDHEDYRAVGKIYDIVFDLIGGKQTVQAFSVIKPGGSVVSVAGPPDREFIEKFGKGFLVRSVMNLTSRRVFAKARKSKAEYFRFMTESDGTALSHLLPMVESGQIKPVIDRVFPMHALPEAMEYQMTGRAQGKIVLQVSRTGNE
jgi:NADPH:quinone reductase-like Zn-dependent oxidoreductase